MKYRKFFPVYETECHCGCQHDEISELFMNKMYTIRKTLDFPLIVTSGYRCPDHNLSVSGKSTGPHTTGHAIDIQIHGGRAVYLIKEALLEGMRGIGVKQTGPLKGRFIHLDDLDTAGFRRPWLWSYSE